MHRRVKAGFILDKLATDEDLGIDPAELSAYVTQQAYQLGVQPDRLARELADRGQLGSVAADVLRTKAVALLAERATVTDESGRAIDIKALEAEAVADAQGETVTAEEAVVIDESDEVVEAEVIEAEVADEADGPDEG